MGKQPYARPIGKRSVIGRAWLAEFGSPTFVGNRLLSGEILFRTDKVKNITELGGLNGYSVVAEVASENPLLCELPGGVYTAWIKLPRYSAAQLESAIARVKATEVWQDMVSAHLNSVGDYNVLDSKRFTLAPNRIVDALEGYVSHVDFPRIQADCNCKDVEIGYCKHIASVCYVLVKTCETDHLPYLRGIGVDLQAMMGEYKRSPKLKRLRQNWAFSPTEPRRKVNRRLTPEDAGYSPEEPILL